MRKHFEVPETWQGRWATRKEPLNAFEKLQIGISLRSRGAVLLKPLPCVKNLDCNLAKYKWFWNHATADRPEGDDPDGSASAVSETPLGRNQARPGLPFATRCFAAYGWRVATEASVDAAPLDHRHDLPVVPHTTTSNHNCDRIRHRERGSGGIPELDPRGSWLYFGGTAAFQCRLDESLDQPGLLVLEYSVSTWAECLRQNMRMPVYEMKVFKKAWNLHEGEADRLGAIFSRPRDHAPAGLRLLKPTFMNTSRMPTPKIVRCPVLLRFVT